MKTNVALVDSETGLTGEILEQAFARFSESSERLEQRYQELVQETECLRQQIKDKDIELKRAEKLSMLGETAAAIAHEVRNPLGALKLFASLLISDLKEQPEALKIVQHMDNTIVSLEHVVTNILHFARETPSKKSLVNLHSLISGQVEHFQAAYQGKVDITVELNGNPFLLGHEAGLRQALHNLILNAMQASPNGGEIKISCLELPGGNISLEIADSGPGIDPAIKDSIFEPFVTSKNEGTGLGLALVKRVMQEHGASIRVTNQKGANFTFEFPIISKKGL